MKITDLKLRLKIGLFLFSHGDEIVEFGVDQIEQTKAFIEQRVADGKAMFEKLMAEWQGTSLAKSDENLKIAALQAITEQADFEARVKQISGELGCSDVDFATDLIEAIIYDPATVRGMIDSFAVESIGISGIPGDYTRGLDVEASSVGWHMADQESWREVWKLTDGGKGVLVVTCDTGSTPTHPDIQGDDRRAFTLSVVPGEPSGLDNNFHGTHCEGTNTGQNGIGVAPNATAASVQCLSARGSGLSQWTAQAINIGLDKAIELNMPVVFSISIGGGGPDAATTAALLRASKLHETHGIPAIVCVAAGNSGYQGRPSTDWPSNDVNAASIAAFSESGLIARFSSGGPNVDMAFPGENIISANFRGGRSASSGTSMATPGAAGYAAIMQSFLLKHGFAQLRNTTEFIAQCTELATDAGEPGEDNRFGSGILEVFKIMQEKTPDDVKLLASSKPPTGKIATVVALFLSLVIACGCPADSNAQEIVTTITTTKSKVVSYNGKKIKGPTTISETIETETAPANVIEFDAEKIVLIGSDLKRIELSPVAEGVFIVPDPGEYLVFPYPLPDGKPVTVAPPVPDIDLSTIATMASNLADRIDDSATRKRLAEVYQSAADKVAGMELGAAGEYVKAEALKQFNLRSGDNRFSDWVNGFQRPLQAELDRIGFDDVESYQAALREVAKGLAGEASASLKINCPGEPIKVIFQPAESFRVIRVPTAKGTLYGVVAPSGKPETYFYQSCALDSLHKIALQKNKARKK